MNEKDIVREMLFKCITNAINSGLSSESSIKDLNDFLDLWLRLNFKE